MASVLPPPLAQPGWLTVGGGKETSRLPHPPPGTYFSWQPIYVVADGLPSAAQDELDQLDLAVTGSHAPVRCQARFVVVTVEPETSDSAD